MKGWNAHRISSDVSIAPVLSSYLLVLFGYVARLPVAQGRASPLRLAVRRVKMSLHARLNHIVIFTSYTYHYYYRAPTMLNT